MTADLNYHWRARLPPFDGVTLRPPGEGWLALPQLRQVLAALIPELRRAFSEHRLFAADDWHDHDGFVTEPREISWDAVQAWMATDEKLCAVRHRDTCVRRVLFPHNNGFYLRFYIPDETETADLGPGWSGTFDVTTTRELSQRVAALVAASHGVELMAETAGSYFDRCYEG